MLALNSAHQLGNDVCPRNFNLSLTAENYALILVLKYEGASSIPSFVGIGQSLGHAHLSYLSWNVC